MSEVYKSDVQKDGEGEELCGAKAEAFALEIDKHKGGFND